MIVCLLHPPDEVKTSLYWQVVMDCCVVQYDVCDHFWAIFLFYRNVMLEADHSEEIPYDMLTSTLYILQYRFY